MQVANDAASAKELPSCEARPGRRVNNSAAGKLQGGKLREDCVEASSVASALAPWSAVMLASRLASCAATKASVARPSRAFAIFVSTSSGVSNPSTVESREASALASALPRRAASRAAVVTASRRAAAILESTSEEVLTVDCRAYAVRTSALEACSPEIEASLLASSGQRRGGDGPQESHLGVHLQRRDPRRYVQGVLVHHRLEASWRPPWALLAEAMEPFMAAVVL